MRSDILRTYRDIHSWVGIISGLALFIAFYAGAITMFEAPLQRWASPPSPLVTPTPLENVPVLVDKLLAQHPEAARSYQIVLNTGPEQPTRLNWSNQLLAEDSHAEPSIQYADLMPDGTLVVMAQGPSPVAQLIDDLHRKVGLPVAHDIAYPIMGAIAVLYSIALVSGVVLLIPTLVKDLFALRIGKNIKRMWLDFHNLLGFFSLPFHLVMALTSVVFAFHDPFYAALDRFVGQQQPSRLPSIALSEAQATPLSPVRIVERIAEQAPDVELTALNYRTTEQGLGLRVMGSNPRYAARSPAGGLAEVDPYTGTLLATDYLPGHQDAWFATVTSFFTLHFGSFGGGVIRWSYFLLGLAGAMLFYTGNLLWLETKRKKRRKADREEEVVQPRSAHLLGALSVGVTLGCVAGISLTIAAAKILPYWVEDARFWHSTIYYAVFVAAIAWALLRGVANGAVELLLAAALATVMIPAISLISLLSPDWGWNHYDYSLGIDFIALIGTGLLYGLARKAATRIKRAPRDSIWFIDSRYQSAKQNKARLSLNTSR